MTRLRQISSMLVLLFTLVWMTPTQAQPQIDPENYEQNLNGMVQVTLDLVAFQGGTGGYFEAIGNTGDPLYIAPLIDISYFLFRQVSAIREINGALAQLTGLPDDTEWEDYFQWAGENDIALPPGYAQFKGRLYGNLIDPEFERFFLDGSQETARINMQEVIWGGVRVDGIPPLVNAKQISVEDALAEGQELSQFCRAGNCQYPAPDEFVFGVYINGDARAYPLRHMNWHEMFNDVIGHTPMFDAPNGEQVCNFRAPTEFTARGYLDGHVLIHGESADCPTDGYLAVDDLVWQDGQSWDDVQAQLPEITPLTDILGIEEGITGQVNGMPVMLAYCTLCGSGILYDVTIPDLTYTNFDGEIVDAGETVLEFSSTGMLMRSNKLMYDRNTDTVWNALTGEPAFGALTSTDIQLDILPVVVTDWASWVEQHPDTSVLSLETGFSRPYRNGEGYVQYFNAPNYLMFPVFQQDNETVDRKDMVFGLRFGGEAKAYPLEVLANELVTNDTFAGEDIVIITQPSPERTFFEPGGAAVRAYDSGGLQLSMNDAGAIVDSDGKVWQLTEDALIADDGRELARLPGHLAFWFGWFGFYPDTLVYEGNV